MSNPSERSLAAMKAASLVRNWRPGGVLALDPITAAEVADRLVAEAVEAERRRIRVALRSCDSYHWTAERTAWVRMSDVLAVLGKEQE